MVQSQRIVLSVPDISCEHCRMRIEGAVGQLPGVARVEVDIASKTVAVEYGGSTAELSIIKGTIADEGYTVAEEQLAGD